MDGDQVQRKTSDGADCSICGIHVKKGDSLLSVGVTLRIPWKKRVGVEICMNCGREIRDLLSKRIAQTEVVAE
jgi:hypothetical protein